jgi:hypothetical protein
MGGLSENFSHVEVLSGSGLLFPNSFRRFLFIPSAPALFSYEILYFSSIICEPLLMGEFFRLFSNFLCRPAEVITILLCRFPAGSGDKSPVKKQSISV